MQTLMRLEEGDVNKRLRELHLTRDIVLSVVRACVTAYGGCTDNDPPSARGYETWRFGTRVFRELLLPGKDGWIKDDTANLPRFVTTVQR